MNPLTTRVRPERDQTSARRAAIRRAALAGALALGGPLCLPCCAQTDAVTYWNEVASSVTTSWRAPTIAHLAMHDALNSINSRFERYATNDRAPSDTSPDAAVAAAAHRVLNRLVPEASTAIADAYAQSLAAIPPGPARDQGIALGERIGDAMINLRSSDGFDMPASYNPAPGTGVWQPTPPAFAPAATPEWATMRPFAIVSPWQFRPDPPPALTSEVYTRDYNEIRQLGSFNSVSRSQDQTDAALYWAQFTQPAYNRIARAAVANRNLDLWERARVFALVNLANSDANFAAWDAKYAYGFWRPITAIQNGDADGNAATGADANWQPLRPTPNHPDYVAGHTTSAGAVIRVLQLLLDTDDVPTTTVGGFSVTRTFSTLSGIVDDVILGRVAIGVHFRFSCITGARLGRQVGQYTFRHYLQPVHGEKSDDTR